MKVLKVLCLMAAIVVFASQAFAATVTISGTQTTCTGTLILNSMNVDGQGNVTLNVTCSGGTCTPASASVNPTIITRNITQGSTATSQSVLIRDNCGTALAYTASVTSVSNFISVPSRGTSPMAVTFNTSGLMASTTPYTGTIQVTPEGYESQNINVSITVTASGGGGNAINMTTSGRQPLYLDNQAVAAGGATNYYLITDKSYSKVTVALESLDWAKTDMDLIISNVQQPRCDQIKRGDFSVGKDGVWYASYIGSSNETVFIKPLTAPIPAGTNIYATVCNFTTSTAGKFRISWSASQ